MSKRFGLEIVFPARAGVILIDDKTAKMAVSLSRTSGGDPYTRFGKIKRFMSFPHERG